MAIKRTKEQEEAFEALNELVGETAKIKAEIRRLEERVRTLREGWEERHGKALREALEDGKSWKSLVLYQASGGLPYNAVPALIGERELAKAERDRKKAEGRD